MPQESPQSHEGEALPEAVEVPHVYQKYVPVATGWLSILILFFLAALGLRKLRSVPGRLQGAWELVYTWIEEIVGQMMGPQGMDYFPLFLTFFLFILISNFLGLVPGLVSPTAKLDTTVALALVAFGSIHVLGMRKKGVFGYWGHFFHVVDSSRESGMMKLIMLPLQYVVLPAIELIGELARPLSLSMRLFGNIMAKEILLGVLASILLTFYRSPGAFNKVLMFVPLLLRPAILLLGVLVSIIQAAVFTVLCMIYIGGATAVHEEHHEGHHEEKAHA
jgi:F-type H+-transporting ATPase subunit a